MAASLMHCGCPAMRTFSQRLILKQLSRKFHFQFKERTLKFTRRIKQSSSYIGLYQRNLAASIVRFQTPSQIEEHIQVNPIRQFSTDCDSEANSVESLVDDVLGGRTPSSLNAEEVCLIFNNLHYAFYDSLSYLPWLQRNRHIAFIQLLLADKLESLPKPIWEHPSMGPLLKRLVEESNNMTSLQLAQTLLSVLQLGAIHSEFIESAISPLLLLCRERVGTFDLETLEIISGIRSRMFQRDWTSMQLELNRFSEILDDPAVEWTPKNAAHLGTTIINMLSLPLANTEAHAVKPIEKLLSLLQDPGYLEEADNICMYLRLARRTFLRATIDQSYPRELISLASDACLKHMHTFDAHNIAEGCAALRQSRCFNSELVRAFRSRGLELLTEDSKLSDVSNLFYSINHHTTIDIKRRYESAIYQRLSAEVDSVILSNLAENFATMNVRNGELLVAFQEHVAEQGDKLAQYTTRFNKIVRLLIRKPFIMPEHETKFKESVFSALDKEFKVRIRSFS